MSTFKNLGNIETNRLLLRKIGSDDAAFILELYNTGDFLRFIGDRNIRTMEDAEKYITEKFEPQFLTHGFGNYLIIRKVDNAKIGAVGIFVREGLEIPDIGFSFLDGFKNQGYGFEAASELLHLAFEKLGFEKISGITAEDNIASQNLLKKLGLQFTKKVKLPDGDEELLYFERDGK